MATTDHAPGFPGWKATVTDRGLGVYLIVAGPGVATGTVSDALVSQLDLYPTLCELAGVPIPAWVEGASLWPLLRGEKASPHVALFAEANFHAALEPQRAIRTDRFRYIRRFDDRTEPVLPNVDDGPSKDWVLREQPALLAPEERRLYDLDRDPLEICNAIGEHEDAAQELDARLTAWMTETDDPLLRGEVTTFPGAVTADPDAPSGSSSMGPADGRVGARPVR